MGSFNISVRSSEALQGVFRDAPASVQKSLRNGSALLAKMDKQHWDKLIRLSATAIESGRSIKPQDFQTDFGIAPDETSDVLAAATFFAGFAAIRKEPAEEITTAAIDAGLVDPQFKVRLTEFMGQVRVTSSTLSQTLEERQLTGEVMPTLREIETALDIRIQLKQQRVDLAVPVIMVHVDTDKDDFYFQMNRYDLENLITRFQNLSKQIHEAQEWIQASMKGSAKK